MTNLRSIRNKFDEFCCQLLSLNVDVAICTETWLSSNDLNDAFNVKGYVCHRTDRRNDRGRGGIALWTKNKFCSRKLLHFPEFDSFEVCCAELASVNLLIIGIYLPPGVAAASFNNFCDVFAAHMDEVLTRFPLHRLIVAGDFNQYNRSFLTANLSLVNIVTKATRLDANLDLIFVDKRIVDSYDPAKVVIGPPIGRSDHRTVFAVAEMQMKRREVKRHVLWDLRLSNVIAFEQRFLSHDFAVFYSSENVEEICRMFYEFMYEAMRAIPQHVIFITSTDAPWMTPMIKFLIDSRWLAYRSRNWAVYNTLKFKVNQEIWRAKKSFFACKSRSVKGLWSYVNMERGSGPKDCFSLIGGSNSLSETLNLLNEHFCSSMSPSSNSSPLTTLHDDSWIPELSVVDVWQHLSRLSCKSTGSDSIPTSLYKKSALILAQPLHHLILHTLRQRKFPSAWKMADVIPVPKTNGGSIQDYRPISLLPIPAKLAEKLILQSLRIRITSLLGDNQFGIRRKSSTTHAIIATHDVMTKHADDSGIGASVFIAFDFSKAFDRIDHQMLIVKAQEANLPSGFIILLADYLKDRRQCVRMNGLKSNSQSITSGVPQGSLLGPYLFGLFIASLQSLHRATRMIKYVDDVSIIAPVHKCNASDDLNRIQAEINNIVSWSTANNMTVNADKTCGFIYGPDAFKREHCIESFLNDVCFRQSVRFLGVILDENLGWKSHVNFIVKKCVQRMYILRRLKSVASSNEFFVIYCSLVRSLIEYACPAFISLSATVASRLDRIQKRCLRIKGISDAADLSSRRRSLALSFFRQLPFVDTLLKSSLPDILPSSRLAVPFCRTSLRRSSFIPFMCIDVSSTHFDH